jgi:hypothetical protein
MKKTAKKTEAGQQYAAAHEAHYKAKDLGEALKLYRNVEPTSWSMLCSGALKAAAALSQHLRAVRR